MKGFYGFFFGLLAAIVATVLWELVMKPAWEKYHAAETHQQQTTPEPKSP